jgi:hypothetical protein
MISSFPYVVVIVHEAVWPVPVAVQGIPLPVSKGAPVLPTPITPKATQLMRGREDEVVAQVMDSELRALVAMA